MLKLIRLIRRLFGCAQSYSIVTVSDVPDTPREGTLYLVGDPPLFWQAVLKCPCGCRATIQLPMDDAKSTNWKLIGSNWAQPTLVPSVDKTSGCRSHFVLRAGKVIWC